MKFLGPRAPPVSKVLVIVPKALVSAGRHLRPPCPIVISVAANAKDKMRAAIALGAGSIARIVDVPCRMVVTSRSLTYRFDKESDLT